MPVQDGEYRKLTKEEIQERLENNLEAQFDTTAQPGDLVTQQLAAEAATLAQNQEEALERVHQAAYLADATGKELDKVVDVIGLVRKEATSATGVVRFARETPPTSNYTIPSGTEVQTSGSTPIKFTTTSSSGLDYIGGFEDANLNSWEGDKASFDILNTTELSGDYALEVPATDGVSITTSDSSFGIGATFTTDIYPHAGSVTGFRFGLQDQSNYFECVVDENAQDLKLRLVESGAESALSVNDLATVPVDSRSHLEIDWGMYEDTTATLYETEHRDVELCSVTLSAHREWEDGAFSVVSLDGNSTSLVDEISTRRILVNIQAVGSGVETNLGPDTITTISRSLAGIETVTNPVATGSSSIEDTRFEPLLLGEEREDDEQLRERAFNSTSIGGSATVNAIKTELQRVEGVQALTLNRNRTENVKDGLPPHSFEAIVYGGTDEDIGQAIFNTASIDSHDVGGINGTEATHSIVSDVTNDTEVISWSRPNRIDVSLELNLVVDDTYVGEAEIRSIIANYIGGTDVDGSFVAGLDVGEDIYQAVLKRKVVNPDKTGVWEVDTLSIDRDGDGTDDSETTASGAEILGVADNEVAIANARDGSITITKTQR